MENFYTHTFTWKKHVSSSRKLLTCYTYQNTFAIFFPFIIVY